MKRILHKLRKREYPILQGKLGILNIVIAVLFLFFTLATLVLYVTKPSANEFVTPSVSDEFIYPNEGVYRSTESDLFSITLTYSTTPTNQLGVISLTTPNTTEPITLPFTILGNSLFAIVDNNNSIQFNILDNTSLKVTAPINNAWPGILRHEP